MLTPISERGGAVRCAKWLRVTAYHSFGDAPPLDVVLVPVVGYDRRGNRLGMGAGFYDRALRRRLDARRAWRRPRLVGVAFACQELPGIAASPWDVPLDLIVTEQGIVVPEHCPDTRQRSAR